ncbi:hypothetical protein [Archangium sp.]|uniref:hypothetical protein n=1 Tax=Archangium sp. TaxID=1872627 RepID=UPI00286AB55F|nr:hypothetical protein [Archangium sp.]
MTNLSRKNFQAGADRHVRALIFTLLLTSAPGCGPLEDAGEQLDLEDTQSQPIQSTNGLAMNGLAMNGLAMNGLAVNGLAMNGLAVNGLSAQAFADWFQKDPALSDMVMQYTVRCAVPTGGSRTYTDPTTKVTYTWQGSLGLAPGWASGVPANTAEQRVITACMAAHANRFGLHLTISVLGRSATGAVIPYTRSELRTYSAREACFFGNLFTGEGVYVGIDVKSSYHDSITRACAQEDSSNTCAPLILMGRCRQYCTLDGSGLFYKACTYNGATYPPITTRLTQEDSDHLAALFP